MKPSLCHGFLLVCLSFSIPSWAEDDAVIAAYVPTVDPVDNYLDAIDDNEAVHGAYSTELADLYMGLGQSLMDKQDYDEAKKAFQQGVLITRVNFGLNSPDQTNYLFAVASIENIQGHRRLADKVLDDIYRINIRNYGEYDPGMLPVLDQLLKWYVNNRPVNSSENRYEDLERSELLTSKMAAIIELDKGLGHPDTTDIYRRVGQLHWVTIKYVLQRGISVEPGVILSTGAPPLNVGTRSVSVKTLVAHGRNAFAKAVESVREDEDRTPMEYAEVTAQLGDFNLAFGKRKTAGEIYQRAHTILAEDEHSEHMADAYFSTPTPVRFMEKGLQPIVDDSGSADQIGVEVSMTVTRGGRPLDIQILNSPENIPGHELRKIKRTVGDMRFRPRLSDGLPEETQDFVWQVPLVIVNASP